MVWIRTDDERPRLTGRVGPVACRPAIADIQATPATKWYAAESHRGSDQRRRIEQLDHNVSPGIKAPA
jgi:hypothetical protein